VNRAIFLDRDGVINEEIFRGGDNSKPISLWAIEELKLIKRIKNII
jgi:histidinol phosphatase-like enzyme